MKRKRLGPVARNYVYFGRKTRILAYVCCVRAYDALYAPVAAVSNQIVSPVMGVRTISIRAGRVRAPDVTTQFNFRHYHQTGDVSPLVGAEGSLTPPPISHAHNALSTQCVRGATNYRLLRVRCAAVHTISPQSVRTLSSWCSTLVFRARRVC